LNARAPTNIACDCARLQTSETMLGQVDNHQDSTRRFARRNVVTVLGALTRELPVLLML